MLYILCRTVVLHCTSHSVAYSIFVPFFVVVIRVLFNTAHTTTFAFITNTNLWFQGFICYSEVPFSAGGIEREREREKDYNIGTVEQLLSAMSFVIGMRLGGSTKTVCPVSWTCALPSRRRPSMESRLRWWWSLCCVLIHCPSHNAGACASLPNNWQ